MIDTTKPIYRINGFIVIDGGMRALDKVQHPDEYAEAEALLKEYPELEIEPPQPPAPTPEQLAAAARATIQAQLDEIDRKTIRPMRAGETDKVAALEAEAEALRKKLAKIKE